MNTVVCVPYRAGQGDRDRIWGFVGRWWAGAGLRVVTGDTPGEFSRSAARNAAVAAAGDEWDVALIADADLVLASSGQAYRAAALARETEMICCAHHRLELLDPDATGRLLRVGARELLRTGRVSWRGETHTNTWDGLFAVPRSLWERVGGYDERFAGHWGQGIAFWAACRTLGGGSHRVPGGLYHLWHEPTFPNQAANPDYPRNLALWHRYEAAIDDRDAMLQLLDERPAHALAVTA